MELQKKLDAFRANFETQIGAEGKSILDTEAVRVRSAGVEERALKAGQRAPDFELPDMRGEHMVSLSELHAQGPLALIFYRGLW